MTNHKLLYKIGESKGNSSRLELVNRSGQEKEISDFFKEHLENIFPTLKLLETEWDCGKGRLDAISWYQQERTFVILEYKSVEYQRQNWLEQINRYLGIEKYKLVKLWNETYPKESISFNDVNWESLKMVYIVPNLSKPPAIDERVIWIRSEWYSNASENAVILASEDKAFSELTEIKTKLGEVSAEIRTKIANQKPNKELIGSVKESIWKEKWTREVERIKAEHASGGSPRAQYKNWFCCLCGKSGREKFRIGHPHNNLWTFFNLTKKKHEAYKRLVENVDVNKPPICRECFSKFLEENNGKQ